MIQQIVRLHEPIAYRDYLALQNQLRLQRRELLLVCEHPRTITAGVTFKKTSLHYDAAVLQSQGIDFFEIGRGGDVTAHEPGQVVFYPHLDLKRREFGISLYFKELLASGAEALESVFNIRAHSLKDAPGLYLDTGEKIASIGVQFKSFFTSHGIAINVCNDLSTFKGIDPCGDPNLKITSVSQQLGRPVDRGRFVDCLMNRFMKTL
ncbi:MAG: lipoyl(octanoyl) transferase LipB [Leptospirales bacterium]|nr:lipoyl(octanoyl) transferase LipB [Leptospirales bacterium]